MTRHCIALAVLSLLTIFGYAQPSLPSSFQAKTVHSTEGADIFVRWGGTGAVVVLLHGYAENSDSWAPLAADLKTTRSSCPTCVESGDRQSPQVDTTRRRKQRTSAQ